MKSSLWNFGLSVVLLGLALDGSAGCGHKKTDGAARTGRLQLSLVGTSNSGVQYRLRSGVFHITGPTETDVSSEADPQVGVLKVELATGDYQVELLTGWYLEKAASDGSFAPVNAILVSDNPVGFAILDQTTTTVQFRFKAGSDVIPIGSGVVAITIAVDDGTGGSAGNGGATGSGGSTGSGGAGGTTCSGFIAATSWKQIAAIPPTNGVSVGHIEAIHRLNDDPTTLLVGSQNQGATCGGGTPASIWTLTLDPQTGLATNISQQALGQIQMLRQSLFESSDGTLFTGSGWCGFTPPYYSTDHGRTWAPAATGGVYPQNSAFTYQSSRIKSTWEPATPPTMASFTGGWAAAPGASPWTSPHPAT